MSLSRCSFNEAGAEKAPETRLFAPAVFPYQASMRPGPKRPRKPSGRPVWTQWSNRASMRPGPKPGNICPG